MLIGLLGCFLVSVVSRSCLAFSCILDFFFFFRLFSWFVWLVLGLFNQGRLGRSTAGRRFLGLGDLGRANVDRGSVAVVAAAELEIYRDLLIVVDGDLRADIVLQGLVENGVSSAASWGAGCI